MVRIEDSGNLVLHPLLSGRRSPLSFDVDHRISDDEVALLLEAARWAPSAGNSQPWGFVTARREEARHPIVARHLAPSARRWALSASVLIVNLTHRRVDDTDLEYSEVADYDLGQAVAHITLQAQAMGLRARQFRAFDLEALTKELRVAAGWDVVSMTAIGRAASVTVRSRSRRSLHSLRQDPLAK
jgi:nitroreductase